MAKCSPSVIWTAGQVQWAGAGSIGVDVEDVDGSREPFLRSSRRSTSDELLV